MKMHQEKFDKIVKSLAGELDHKIKDPKQRENFVRNYLRLLIECNAISITGVAMTKDKRTEGLSASYNDENIPICILFQQTLETLVHLVYQATDEPFFGEFMHDPVFRIGANAAMEMMDYFSNDDDEEEEHLPETVPPVDTKVVN